MDLDTAKHLMDRINAVSVIFATLSRDIDRLDEPERSQLMRGLGQTMGEMYVELIRPIGRHYPHLDPANSQR